MPSHHPATKIAALGACVDCGDGCTPGSIRCMPCAVKVRPMRSVLTRQEIVDRMADGETQAQIARSVGVTRQAIHGRLREHA